MDDIPTDPDAPRVFDGGPGVLAPGRVLAGRYEILSRLGAGGMGAVYRALDRELGEEIALKVLHAARLADPAGLERFRREVRLARRVTHPNVCRVFDLGEEGCLPFLTMEMISGRSLRAVLEEGTLPVGRALDLIAQIAAGVAAAHQRGIVHHDLKPENVLIDASGHARVADFGLASGSARDATSTVGAGTPQYMSPEQLRGEAAGPASDVFSLGLVAQETLTGQHPFGEGSAALVTSAILRDPPRAAAPSLPPELASPLAEILAAALAKSPDERPTAADLAGRVAALRSSPRSTGTGRASRLGLTLLLLIAVLVGLGAIGVRLARGPAPPAASGQAASHAAPSAVPVTVMVLPFADLAREPWSESLALAAADGVRAGLRTVPGLAVVDAPPAAWTARGSVLTTGSAARMQLQIEGGRPAAGEPFDVEGPPGVPGPLLDALRIRAADEARLLLCYRERRDRAERETESAPARAKLLAHFDRIGLVPQPADVEIGVRLLDEVVALAPVYPVARVARAEVLTLRAGLTRSRADADAARADLAAALLARPSDPRALALQCSLAHFDLVFEPSPADDHIDAAFAACARAVEAEPTAAVPRRVLAKLYDLRCEDDRAVEELERAASLDRARAGEALAHLVEILLGAGRLEAAERRSAELVSLQDEERRLGDRSLARLAGLATAGRPTTSGAYFLRGAALRRLGRDAEARGAFERELEDAGRGFGGVVHEAAARRALRRLGAADRDERLRRLEGDLRAASAQDPMLALVIASAYRWTDPAAARAWLSALPPPASCGDAVRRASLLHDAGDDPAARRALAACAPSTRWEQGCREAVEKAIGRAP